MALNTEYYWEEIGCIANEIVGEINEIVETANDNKRISVESGNFSDYYSNNKIVSLFYDEQEEDTICEVEGVEEENYPLLREQPFTTLLEIAEELEAKGY